MASDAVKMETEEDGSHVGFEGKPELEGQAGSNGQTNEFDPEKEDNESSGVAGDVVSQADKETIDLEEKRRRECLGNMEKIEREFADLKEKFFAEKIEALKKEHEMIKNGTHQGFLKKCKELDDLKEHKTWAAEKWREYQLQNIENIFLAEKKQAEDEYKADKKTLREKMMNTAMEKRKKLLEEKNTMNLTDFGSDGTERMMTRTTRSKRGTKDPKEQPNYKRRLNPPHINYTLKDFEISEDVGLIQKASANHPSYGKYPQASTPAPAPVIKPQILNPQTFDVYTDKGKLFYYNQVFEKGREIYVESKTENSGKWHGIIVVVNPAEIIIRSPDGTKSRFSMVQLRNGKYTVQAVV